MFESTYEHFYVHDEDTVNSPVILSMDGWRNDSWPLNNTGIRGADVSYGQKSEHNFTVIPLYLWYCIPGFNQLQIV